MRLERVQDSQQGLSTLMPIFFTTILIHFFPWAHLERMYVNLLVK